MRVIVGRSAMRFLPQGSSKPLMLGGIMIPDHEGLLDISDGDVVLQALCQALGAIKGYHNFLKISQDLFDKDGITDSVVLLERCLQFGKPLKLAQVSFSIEIKKPDLSMYIEMMQANIARLLKLDHDRVAISFYEKGGLSDISCGDGISVLALLTILD